MKRMGTLLSYALMIVVFIFLSYILEDGLIANMYKEISGDVLPSKYAVSVENVSGRATTVNGYMNFTLKNNSSNYAPRDYIKIDLYSERGLTAMTKYIEVPELAPGATKDYQVKIKGTNIRAYKMEVVDELPDKTNIISLFGWEIDLTNVFGMDLSNLTILGAKLTDIFSWDGLVTGASNIWTWFIELASSVPWWGYTIASMIIFWNMPKGFLFGVFPF